MAAGEQQWRFGGGGHWHHEGHSWPAMRHGTVNSNVKCPGPLLPISASKGKRQQRVPCCGDSVRKNNHQGLPTRPIKTTPAKGCCPMASASTRQAEPANSPAWRGPPRNSSNDTPRQFSALPSPQQKFALRRCSPGIRNRANAAQWRYPVSTQPGRPGSPTSNGRISSARR